jgi:hypothetical protein
MDERKVDVFVYPSWNDPPCLIGDLNTLHGNNSPRISRHHCPDGLCPRVSATRPADPREALE